jgi:hypothetical protein
MIYKSSAAYSFSKSSKNTEKGFLNKSQIANPDSGIYYKEILNKPSGGFKFSKEEKFKTFRLETPGPGNMKQIKQPLEKVFQNIV